MAKAKFDGVVEAVHYDPEGKVKWVRAYVRRGKTFSDIVLLDRKELAEQLRSGKNFMSGKRIPLRASTFEVSKSLRLVQQGKEEHLVAGDKTSDKDYLEGVPVI